MQTEPMGARQDIFLRTARRKIHISRIPLLANWFELAPSDSERGPLPKR